MRFAAYGLLFSVLMVGLALRSAQAEDSAKPMYTASATAKFMNIPGLPTCMKASVLSGDSTKGAFLLLVKTATGCVIPWHWHTITESLMFVSGQGKGETKDGTRVMLHAGDYLTLPGKGVHQFTCMAACTFFLGADGAFDIHYVDAAGKEISPDEALKAKAKAKMPMKKEMKDMKDMKM
jgi:quercetin dioxygenase-like cupin family protein